MLVLEPALVRWFRHEIEGTVVFGDKRGVHANATHVAVVGLKEISVEIFRAEMVCLLYIY